MELQGHFTAAGLNLLAQLAIDDSPLVITRVVASSEKTEDISAAVQVSPVFQTLKLKNLKRSGQTLTIPAVLQAQDAEEDYLLQELGVYAQGLNDTEVLYQIYQLSEPITVQAESSMVLQFYLQDTIADSMDVIVTVDSGVYLTQSDLGSLEERILPKVASIREISLDIAQLQTYLDGLPRLLNEYLTIHVSGTLDGRIHIRDFYGSGSLRINADSAGNCTIDSHETEAVFIENCAIPVRLDYLTIQIYTNEADHIGILADRNKYVDVRHCTVQGNSTAHGMAVYSCSGILSIGGSGRMSNCEIAVRCGEGLIAVNSGSFSSFSIGAYAYYGAIITIYSSVNKTLGGSSNGKDGGIVIYNASVI